MVALFCGEMVWDGCVGFGGRVGGVGGGWEFGLGGCFGGRGASGLR